MKQLALRTATAFVLLAALVGGPAAAQERPPMILDVAIDQIGVFSTLFTAATCTDVAALLDSDRRFTLFAPTNDAFAELGLSSANVCEADLGELSLVDVLLYHIVPGRQTADKVLGGAVLRTLNGQVLAPSVSGGAVFIDDAQVVAADVGATNGVIHVIDKVLIP